jgi:hypothetical protein
VVLLVVALYVAVSDRLLSREEKRLLADGIAGYLAAKCAEHWGWASALLNPPRIRMAPKNRANKRLIFFDLLELGFNHIKIVPM